MLDKKIHRKKAFTMIELLVSATIIILLTTIGLVSFRQASISSRNSKRKADLESIKQALTIYKQDNGYYFNDTTVSFEGLVTMLKAGEYLSENSFIDPKNEGAYIYAANCERTASGNCTKVSLSTGLEPDEEAYTVSTF